MPRFATRIETWYYLDMNSTTFTIIPQPSGFEMIVIWTSGGFQSKYSENYGDLWIWLANVYPSTDQLFRGNYKEEIRSLLGFHTSVKLNHPLLSILIIRPATWRFK